MIRKLVICVLALILLQSCVSLALKAFGIDAKKAKPRYISSSNKELVFIGMHHIGKKEFYKDVFKITDSLGRMGYTSFYESVQDDVVDTITLKKVRKITGLYLSKDGYLDTVTNKLVGKFKVHEDYVNQPTGTNLHKLISRKSNPKKVDIPISNLVNEFEKKHGTVVLDSCDIYSNLTGTYKCVSYKDTNKEKRKAFMKDYVQGLRDKHLATSINNSKHDKIIVVYGRAHYKGLYEELKKIDDSWGK